MRESALSHRAAEESLPLRDAFSVLFFVSVGMLFDPAMLVREPLHVLVVVAIIMIGKTLAAVVLVLAFRYPLNTALTVSAQPGADRRVLVHPGRPRRVSCGLLPVEGQSLILAGALISIALNPLVFAAIEPVQRVDAGALCALPARWSAAPIRWPSCRRRWIRIRSTGHVVLVGYGRVGRRIADALDAAAGFRIVVAEQNRELVEQLREREHSGRFGRRVASRRC